MPVMTVVPERQATEPIDTYCAWFVLLQYQGRQAVVKHLPDCGVDLTVHKLRIESAAFGTVTKSNARHGQGSPKALYKDL